MKPVLYIQRIATILLLSFAGLTQTFAITSPSSAASSYIESISFGNTSNTMSGPSNTTISGYSDWTSVAFNAVECMATKVQVQFGGTHSSDSIYDNVAIWIDLNNDLVFDASEKLIFEQNHYMSTVLLGLGSFQNAKTDYVSIPSGFPGLHRMRVRYLDTTTIIDPNTNSGDNGETEDYMIQIQPQTCFPAATILNSAGYVDAEVLISADSVATNQPFTAYIAFDLYTYSCGYIQWYYTTDATTPLRFTEIPNSNSTTITFSYPATGAVHLWATGMVGCPEKFFLARGSSILITNASSTAQQVPNDKACDAIDIFCGVNPTVGDYTNTDASIDADEFVPPTTGCSTTTGWCNGQTISNTVWFKYLVPSEPIDHLTISVEGSGSSPLVDAQLAAYFVGEKCDDPSAYQFIAANDDAGVLPYTNNPALKLKVSQITPKEYLYFQVDGKNLLVGNFKVKIAITPANTASSVNSILASPTIVSVFPNPFDDLLTISYVAGNTVAHYSLYDTQGRQVIRQESSIASIKETFNTSHLSPGVYFLHVDNDTGTQIKKVVKVGN